MASVRPFSGASALARFLLVRAGMRTFRSWCDYVAASATRVLVVTDLDGTLTSIAPDPSTVRLGSRATIALRMLSNSPRCQLAVVTGRTLSDSLRIVGGVNPAWLVTEHGAVVRDPSGNVRFDDVPPAERAGRLRERAQEIARVFDGARVEDKSFGVALHFREVAEPKHESLASMFRLACAVQRARFVRGRSIVEGTFCDATSGTALLELLAAMPADTAFVYAGDDATDEPALSIAEQAPQGFAVYVRSGERPTSELRVNARLESPDEWIDALGQLASVLIHTQHTAP